MENFNFRINFPGYDEMFLKPKTDNKGLVNRDQTADYFTTRFNTKMLDSVNITAENELSGRNQILTKSGMSGFTLNSTSKLSDSRPVVLNTPELLNSAYDMRESKSCSSVKHTEYTRLDGMDYRPHPKVYYQPNSFLGLNSREVKRNDFKLNKK
jgi:hypothetical protein